MARDLSECQTFTDEEEGMPEPETEDFFYEVVPNSLKTKKKVHPKGKEPEEKGMGEKEGQGAAGSRKA
jgi:hypothetical protein